MNRRLLGRSLLAAAILVAACTAGDRSLPFGPQLAISDGAHAGGTPGFYFLPPMVPQPIFTGVFDPDIAAINPVVVICDVTDGPDVDCGGATPALRTFTTTSVPAILIDGERYKVDWDTKEGDFAAGRTYRVHVLGGIGPNQRELGFADILLTTEPGKVKHLANDEMIVLNDGRTLPIHMRIEIGVVVPPGPAVAFELTGVPASVVAGADVSVTVTARDANGQVATGYHGTVTFAATDPQAVLPANYAFIEGDEGIQTFADLSFRTAGSVTVRVADVADVALLGEAMLIVEPGGAAALELTGLTDAVAGTAQTLTVTARDAFGNAAAGYTGTVQFTSSDPAAVLPAAYQFQHADAGVHTFTDGVSFKTAGTASLAAGDGTLSTSLTVVVQAGAAVALRFTAQPSDALAGATLSPVVVTSYDAFDNVATGFTGQVTITIGTNPGGGTLSGTSEVAAGLGVATFDDLSIDRGGSGYTFVVSAGGLTSATSDPFDVVAPTPVEAHWINAAGGLWSVGSNWSTGTAPTSDQEVFIDLEGTYTVTLDVDATVNRLTLGAASGVQTLSAGSTRILALATSGSILSAGRMLLSGATINGSGTLTNAGGTLSLSHTSTITTALVNAGTLLAGVPPFASFSTINGPFTTAPGSLVRVHAGGSNTATLVVANGFTNHGTIELTKASDVVGEARLTVSSGTLVNASDGTIRSLLGSGGGRVLTAQLDNQGTVTLDHLLAINRGGADHINSGLVQVSGGNLTLTQSGTSPSFTNAGTITVGAGRTWGISGGSFTQHAGATLDGGGAMSLTNVNPAAFGAAFSLGALTLTSSTASFGVDVTTATLALRLTNSTLNGPGILTNAAGKTLSLSHTSTINTALVNAGTLLAGVPPFASSSTINGPFTTAAGSLVRVHAGGSNTATLTVANGFTNHGTIELTKASDVFGEARLVVTNGTLVNASDGTIRSLLGSGGGRTLTAQLDNQGTVTLDHVLTINGGSAQHTNSGMITVTGGSLVVTQSGTSPSFSNGGVIDVGTTRAMRFTGGTVANEAGGTIQGAGTFEAGSTTPFTNAGSVTANIIRIGNTLTGSGPFAPTTADFFGSATSIPVDANYSYTNVRVFSGASFAGSKTLAGDLTIAAFGNLTIAGHEIVVTGAFATLNSSVLTMQNSGGVLVVSGNATFAGGSTNGRVSAGVLRVAGDFTQTGTSSAAAFAASSGHLTVLDGAGTQTVSFSNPGPATTASHFQRLEIANASAGGVVLNSAAFANGQLRTPPSLAVVRLISGAGVLLTAGGLDAYGLGFDGIRLRVMNGEPIARFDNATFRNMDPAVTQFRLDRLNDAVTFINIAFETEPSTGAYLHLVDTDLGGTLFTVTMQNTTPANHGGKVIESVAGQLLGWPL